MGRKDEWNATDPEDDKDFLPYVQHPELASLLPVLYPGVFPNLAALNASGASRADLVAILLTGLPRRDHPRLPEPERATGKRYADLLRLNVAIPPAASPNNLGLLGGDLAGFPNGRRLADDIVAIELRRSPAPPTRWSRRTRPTARPACSRSSRSTRRRPAPAGTSRRSRTSGLRTTGSARRRRSPQPTRRSGGPTRRRSAGEHSGGGEMHDHDHHGHDHTHGHDHAHPRPPRPRLTGLTSEPSCSRSASELGALVVHTDPALLHTRDRDQPRRATTSGAATRTSSSASSAGRSLYAAVFDRLPGGAYTLWYEGVARHAE